MDGRANGGWTAMARRDAPIVIQIAAAYKRWQKFAVKRDASRHECKAKRVEYLSSECQFLERSILFFFLSISFSSNEECLEKSCNRGKFRELFLKRVLRFSRIFPEHS